MANNLRRSRGVQLASTSGGSGISSATSPTTYTAASFSGLSFRTITTTKRIAYITLGTIGSTETQIDVDPTITYTSTTVTFDLGSVPTENVNVYYFN